MRLDHYIGVLGMQYVFFSGKLVVNSVHHALFMKRFAVFGYPIAHSLSPQIHTQFAAQFGEQIQYTREEATPQDFPDKVRSFFAEGGIGCNVTAPHKQTALNLAEVCQRPRASCWGCEYVMV